MSEVYWRNKFPEAYQAVEAMAPDLEKEPWQWIHLALDKELLSSEDYLLAAQAYYSLAVLNDRFFTEQFSTQVYEKYKMDFAWSPQAIPVMEWDGVVFVACLNPHQVPSDLPFPCRPILASYEGLKWAWNRTLQADQVEEESYQASEADHDVAKIEVPQESEVVPPHQPPPMNDSQNLMNFDRPLRTPPPPTSQNLFELVDSAPEPEETPEIEEHESAASEPGMEMPEGLDFGMSAPPSAAAPTSEDLFAASNEIPPTKAPTPPPPTSLPKMPPAPPPVRTAPPPRIKVEEEKGFDLTIINKPEPQVSANQEIEEELMLCFAKAFQSYRNLMILKIAGDKAIPFRWDPSYKPPKSIAAIDLSEPSVFRIAARTQKPFHGPVVPNPINSDFFEAWFGGIQPGYLTIVPIFFEGDLTGLLLAATDHMEDLKGSLHLMQATAQKIESNFGARIAV